MVLRNPLDALTARPEPAALAHSLPNDNGGPHKPAAATTEILGDALRRPHSRLYLL
jgi:hypothetical protein